MVSLSGNACLFHFPFHCRAKMIDDFVLETLYHDSAVIEILYDKVNMLVVQVDHDPDT